MTDDRSEDLSYENEGKKDYSPMVQISLKEYDKMKERSKYITDRDLIGCIDKIEELVRALRKHIVRSDFK
jgi:superfamily I DNA and/or RNA helicase|tara:strand:+ start:198 stop:407 length:210 start_codon:yes stop_codon:yes gene_type:complete